MRKKGRRGVKSWLAALPLTQSFGIALNGPFAKGTAESTKRSLSCKPTLLSQRLRLRILEGVFDEMPWLANKDSSEIGLEREKILP